MTTTEAFTVTLQSIHTLRQLNTRFMADLEKLEADIFRSFRGELRPPETKPSASQVQELATILAADGPQPAAVFQPPAPIRRFQVRRAAEPAKAVAESAGPPLRPPLADAQAIEMLSEGSAIPDARPVELHRSMGAPLIKH